jgi:RNA polymerase sigma-32 factor
MAYVDDLDTQRSNKAYIRLAMKAPLLEREHELELARRWREDNDERALHELISSYTRLVVSLASKFRNYGLPMGDLVQEGNIGLMQAAARFEPEREVRFSTYATWWIRSAIQDYILRNWSIVRTGTTSSQKTLFFNLRRLRAKIEDNANGRLTDAGRAEIATKLGVAVRDVERMETRISGFDQSLNAPLTESGEDSAQDFIADDRPSPEEVVIGAKDARTRSQWLAEALAELSPREQSIIRQRRLTEEGATLEELGKELGVSKERVRQLETRALDKLKQSLIAHVDQPADMLLAH